MYNAAMDIHVIPNHPHDPPRTINLLFENFKIGFIDSIASDFEFCKDGSKVSVQIQTLHSLQSFVENAEKTNIMMKSALKQQQEIKSQSQFQAKNGQNGSTFSKPNEKNW